MHPACPRCRAPLNGPFCAACGLRLDGQQPLPPLGQGQAYPPVQGQVQPPYGQVQPPYGQPPMAHPGMMQPAPQGWGQPQPGVQYMGPGGVPYMVMQMPGPQAPSKRWAMVGGIMDLVACGFYVLIGLIGMIAASSERGDDKGAAMAGLFVFLLLGVAGIIFGIYAIKGRWGGALGAGILHTLTALICFGAIGAIEDDKKDSDSLSYYYDSKPNEGLEAAQGALVLFALLSLLTAIFCFIGISGARNFARHQQHVRASDHF